MKRQLVTFSAVLLWCACGSSQPSGADAGPGDDAGPGNDAGPDAGTPDSGTPGDAGPPTWLGTVDPDARLPLKLAASLEVARIPAADAPASDSQSRLSAQGSAGSSAAPRSRSTSSTTAW